MLLGFPPGAATRRPGYPNRGAPGRSAPAGAKLYARGRLATGAAQRSATPSGQ